MLIYEIETIPAEIESGYSPSLDRWDVAIRAIWRLFRNGKWALLNELGLTKGENELQLLFADDVVENIYQDEQLAALRTICPKVMDGAAELLRRYGNLTADSKREYYQKKEAEQYEDLSHRVRQRQRHAKRA